MTEKRRWTAEDVELLVCLKVDLDIANWAIAALLDRSRISVLEKCKALHLNRRPDRKCVVVGARPRYWREGDDYGSVISL